MLHLDIRWGLTVPVKGVQLTLQAQNTYIDAPMRRRYTAAVKSLLTVRVLLQQKPESECCAQCKWL